MTFDLRGIHYHKRTLTYEFLYDEGVLTINVENGNTRWHPRSDLGGSIEDMCRVRAQPCHDVTWDVLL